MTQPMDDRRVDAALAAVARDVEPSRDLWPGIESRLEERATRPRRAWAWQAAAAAILVVASSLVTAIIMSRGPAPVAHRPVPESAPVAMPVAFGPSFSLNGEYAAARAQLAAELERRVATMPPSARQKLEANLAEMRRAAEEINAALARQPGDPLLQELLLSTYQEELGVLASVNQLTGTSAAEEARQENVKL
ncbi:MAG: hypothetical protein MUE61_20500 [Vicinamibacterales bacterium]|jgi:hypothetical protein|nr:hypothetical protein [Vicinamibacterales bacterium]